MSLILPQRGRIRQPAAGGITVVETGSSGGTSGATFSASLLENDYVLLIASADTALGSVTTSGYALIWQSGDSNPDSQIFYKRMGATPDTSYAWDSSNACVYIVLRGVSTTGNALDGTLQSASGTSGLPNPPSYTVSTSGSLRIITGHLDDDNISDATAPSGFTLADWDTYSVSISRASTYAAYETTPSTGALDPGAFSSTSGTDQWWATHFALLAA